MSIDRCGGCRVAPGETCKPDCPIMLSQAKAPTPGKLLRMELDSICEVCGAQRDPDTGFCPHTCAACDERAGLREDFTPPDLPPIPFE